MSSSMEPREGASNATCGFGQCLDILRDLPLFGGISLDVVKVLAYLSETACFAPGEALCEQGEAIECCHYVLCGEVLVLRSHGGSEMTMFQRGEGFFWGSLGLLAPAKSLFTVRACGSVQTVMLTREKFLKTADRFPEIVPKLLSNVVEYVFRWEEKALRVHGEACPAHGAELGLSLF